VKKTISKTPLRLALKQTSSLLHSVEDGLGAVQKAHRGYFEPAVKTAISDSLELDEAMKHG